MSKEDLVPIRTTEEAKRKGRNGGKKSGEARRRKKSIREQMQMLLSLPMPEGRAKQKVEFVGIKDKEINNQMAIIYALWAKATKGDTRAFELIQNIIEENKPLDKTELPEIVVRIEDNSNLEKYMYEEKQKGSDKDE